MPSETLSAEAPEAIQGRGGGQLLKKGQFVLLENKQKKLKFRKRPVFIEIYS
jgi:hypothetical protein